MANHIRQRTSVPRERRSQIAGVARRNTLYFHLPIILLPTFI